MAPDLIAALQSHHLVALASLPADPEFCPDAARSLVLIGPMGGASWWEHVTRSAEWLDGQPDPLDRWSMRVLDGVAARFGGRALFPSDGPPFPPFFKWALASGALWQSPVGMLVHAEAGLWVSFRGALAVPFDVPLPATRNPCDTCQDQPCRTACPVNALSPTVYDVAACHDFLNTDAGNRCLSEGCRARGACPASQRHARLAAQSAYHMSRFHT
ncbi:ferredoxin [Pararhodobacter sp.]|uniref:ferredoxin n=1 Tax=Pararhodobacter sp. TaxID=2127056 RepID=UPI002AFDD150|nr:ferredoxin [Pararhodobacter sp.]